MRIIPWHQGSPFKRVTQFIQPFMDGSPGFTDIHQKVFAYWANAVEARLFWDDPEFFFGGSEGDPRGPREGGPSGGEVIWVVGTGRHVCFLFNIPFLSE